MTGLVIAVAAMVVAGVSLTTWYILDDSEVRVDGGVILKEGADTLVVRCLSSEVRLSLEEFSGRVEFTNCFRDAQVQGYQGDVLRNGTRISLTVSNDIEELRLTVPEKQSFKFAVLGDSQGKNDVLEQMLDALDDCEFVIHCGDLTPSAAESEFMVVERTLNASTVPVFTTPGNHDARLGGLDGYESRFGPANYAFTYSGIAFAFVDSSDQSISEDELEFAEKAFGDAQTKILVTHVPSYDPFGSNHTLDTASCDRVQSFALDKGLEAVYTGHVHAYYMLEVEGTGFLITGGAGGTLVDGVHHHMVVTVDEHNLSYEKVDLVTEWTPTGQVSLTGRAGQLLNLTFEEITAMDTITAHSSYENLYGNIGGAGTYSGPPVASLIDLIGGMEEGDILRVTASDGYVQEFGYLNVYASTEWLALQGTMILALECESEIVPDWAGGPRIAFLSPDGVYSNSDCEATSYAGQGYHEYPSAGARWVSYVTSMTVEVGP